MALTLFEDVALLRDIPEQGLRTGDVARLVDIVPGPPGEPEGAVLEVFNAMGEHVCVTAVSIKEVAPLTRDEIFSVRRLARAG